MTSAQNASSVWRCFAGTESASSTVSQKTITAATAAKTVNITITAAPPPTGQLKTSGTRVYDIILKSDGSHLLGKLVGSIALGKPCGETYTVPGTNYYRVNRSYVKFTATPSSQSVVAPCSRS